MNKRLKKNLLLLLLTVLIGCFSIGGTASARAGGGGGGGSSGGGGGGGSSSRSGSSRTGRNNNPVGAVTSWIMFGIVSSGGTIVFIYYVRKAKRQSIRAMRAYRKLGVNWNYREIQKHVEKAYFEIQECWRRYDPDYAAEYLSEELAAEWRTKLGWMKIRKEEIVQKNVKLLSAVPVSVYNEEGEEQDRIWYLIHGKMIDYYRNMETKEFIRGNTRAEDFYEYWLFIRHDGRWVLGKIRQKDEVDIHEFING